MRTPLRHLLPLLAASSGLGCPSEYDSSLEELDETSDAGESGDDSPSPCEVDGGLCVPPVPEGWSGAAIVHTAPTDHPMPECPPDYPAMAATFFDGLSAPAAECDCECGEAEDMECAPAQVGLWKYSCQDEPDEAYEVAPEECVDTDTMLLNPRVAVEALQATGGACQAIPTASVAPATWSERTVVCAAEDAAACEGGSCAQPPAADFRPGICVYRAGDIACPHDYDDERHLGYTEVSDTRDCSACTCDDPVGTCSGAVELHANGWCGQAFGSIGPDECTSTLPVSGLRFAVDQVSGVCAPNPSVPTGAAAPSGAITVCCRAA